MTTFHSRQSDRARRTRKNENTSTFNFTSQIAPSICTVMFTKREKSNATIFKSRCSRTVLCYRFDRVEALPLVSTRFLRLANSSPKTARSPARRSRDVREISGKKSGEMSRVMSAQLSRQWPDSGSSNAAERPSRQLARQLALRRTWTRNVRAGNLRDNSQLGRATAVPQQGNISQDRLVKSQPSHSKIMNTPPTSQRPIWNCCAKQFGNINPIPVAFHSAI